MRSYKVLPLRQIPVFMCYNKILSNYSSQQGDCIAVKWFQRFYLDKEKDMIVDL